MRLIILTITGFLSLGLSGCGPARLNVTKTFNIGSDKNADIFTFPAQKSAQNVTVDVQASAEVQVYVIKSSALSDIPNKLPQEWAKAALAANTQMKSGQLKFSIGPGEEWNIVVTTGLKMTAASGTLTITN